MDVAHHIIQARAWGEICASVGAKDLLQLENLSDSEAITQLNQLLIESGVSVVKTTELMAQIGIS